MSLRVRLIMQMTVFQWLTVNSTVRAIWYGSMEVLYMESSEIGNPPCGLSLHIKIRRFHVFANKAIAHSISAVVQTEL